MTQNRNVYQRNDGDWQQYGNGGWSTAPGERAGAIISDLL